jgi:uncharacterized protein (DUF2249 family)
MQPLDLTDLPPAQRLPALVRALDALAPGDGFDFLADRDPAPLYYRCDRERAGQASWQYLVCGPDRWLVHVVRR